MNIFMQNVSNNVISPSFFVIIGKNTIINLQFSMPFVAEMYIKSSSSGRERH